MRPPPIRVAAALLAAVAVAVPTSSLAASDPYRPDQYGLDRIRAEEAWSVARGEGTVVAIVDSGVDLAHPDLVDRFFRDAKGVIVGRDYVDGDTVPQDRNGHGTMVAGIAAAATGNGIGMAGVAPATRIMPIRVLDADGNGRGSDVDAAIRWAVDNGAHVVNLSLESVAPLPGTILSQAPNAAVKYAWDRGVVVVAAAGNSGSPFTDYPASSPVLLVGATDRDDVRASFSDTGRRDAVLAPGVEIISTWCRPVAAGCDPETRYGQASGTSFSAPHVTGAVAVVLSSGRDAATAVRRLRETAEDLGAAGPDAQNGYGRIDLARAVARAGSPSPTPTQTAKPPPSSSPSAAPSSSPRPSPSSPPSDGPSAPPGGGSPPPSPPGDGPTASEPPASGTSDPATPPPIEPPPAGTPSPTRPSETAGSASRDDATTAPGTSVTPLEPPTDAEVVALRADRDRQRPVRALAFIAVLATAGAWVTVWRRQGHAR